MKPRGKPFKKGHQVNNGRIFSVEHRKNLSLANKGKKKKPFTLETRLKMSLAQRGEKSYRWKGGISPIYRKIRMSFEYRLWRDAIFKRDNYTCIWCGQRGGKLNADHIKSFAHFPELRFAIDNGRTLCINCHKTTENYGGRNKNGQFK